MRSLVQMHEGQVVVASEGVGRGTTVSMSLPAARQSAPAPPAFRPALSASARANSKSILVVDDNLDAASMLSEALQRLGYLIRTAHDGPSALATLETFVPDVAVLDIGLPVMDGYELVQQMRKRQGAASVRMIAVTGYGQPDDRARAAAAGFDAHLVKPVAIEQLVAAIEATQGSYPKP